MVKHLVVSSNHFLGKPDADHLAQLADVDVREETFEEREEYRKQVDKASKSKEVEKKLKSAAGGGGGGEKRDADAVATPSSAARISMSLVTVAVGLGALFLC